jgi:hypothetical protein
VPRQEERRRGAPRRPSEPAEVIEAMRSSDGVGETDAYRRLTLGRTIPTDARLSSRKKKSEPRGGDDA